MCGWIVAGSDAATGFVFRDDAATEEALVDADADEGFALDPRLGQVPLINLGDFLDGATEAVGSQLFALEGERFGMVDEFAPDFYFAFGAVRMAANAAGLQGRVEPGEIRQFERDGADGAAD